MTIEKGFKMLIYGMAVAILSLTICAFFMGCGEPVKGDTIQTNYINTHYYKGHEVWILSANSDGSGYISIMDSPDCKKCWNKEHGL